MSFAYRPTPVVSFAPRSPLLSGAVSGGVMRGYDNGVNWKAYFDSQRAATQGSPWIVRSGTMGSFVAPTLGQDDGSDGSLPLPTDIGGWLSPLPLPLPVDLYPLSPPVDPSIVPFTPGTPPIVTAPGGGGSIPATAATNWTQLLNSLSSLGTNIAKAATGQPQINPLIPPVSPVASTLTNSAALVAQAQSLQAQAAAVQTSNPALAATYQNQANQLLAQAGQLPGANWFTQATIIPGMPNWILPAGAGVFIVLLSIGLKSAGRR